MGKSCISEREYHPCPQECAVPNEEALRQNPQIPEPSAIAAPDAAKIAELINELKLSPPAPNLVNRNELDIFDVIRAIQHFDIEDIVRLHVAIGQRLNEYLLKMKAADRILK